jgi:preprotein translocase subunit SecA
MFEFITLPFLRNLVEKSIKASLAAHDPHKIRLKQWLTVAHHGECNQEIWRYQFYRPLPVAIQLQNKMMGQIAKTMRGKDVQGVEELLPEPPSLSDTTLLDVMLDESDQLLQKARAAKWYQRVWGRIRYGKYYPQAYRNQSQHYYKEAFEIWHINKRLLEKKIEQSSAPLRWYHLVLLWCIKKVGVTWQFESEDFTDSKIFFEKISQHEGAQQEAHGVITEIIATANQPTLGPDPFSTDHIRESYTTTQLLSGSPQMQRILTGRMMDKRKKSSDRKDEQTKPVDAATDRAVVKTVHHDDIPDFMRATWLAGLKLTLTQSIDHAHEQQQDISQEQQMDMDQGVDLKRVQDRQRWTDHSAQFEWDIIETRLDPLQYQETIEWANIFKRGMQRYAKISSPLVGYAHLKITEAALDALQRAHGYVRTSDFDFDLDSLPLGFFIDKDTFTLKYSEEYRLFQLENDPNAHIKLDVNTKTSYFLPAKDTFTCTTTKDDLLQTIKERHINLTKTQLDFLDRLDSAQEHNNFLVRYDDPKHDYSRGSYEKNHVKIPIKAFAFRALKCMTEAIYSIHDDSTPEKQDPYLGKFIDILETFDTHALDNFILTYLKDIKDIKNGRMFYGKKWHDALKRYQKIKQNEAESSWLHVIQNHQSEMSLVNYNFEIKSTNGFCSGVSDGFAKNIDFFETINALSCFFDYFKKELGLPVPHVRSYGKRDVRGLDGTVVYDWSKTIGINFLDLKHMLDCMSLAGYGKEKDIKKLQSEFIFCIPSAFYAKRAFRSGYAFVHVDMLLDEERMIDGIRIKRKPDDQLDVPIPARSDFEKITYDNCQPFDEREGGRSDCLRAMYLRFIACCIHPSEIRNALKKWEEMTGEKLADDKPLDQRPYFMNIQQDRELKEYEKAQLEEVQTQKRKADSLLQTHWESLKQYALSLPPALSAPGQPGEMTADSLPDAFINEKNELAELEKRYTEEDIDSLLKKINLPSELGQSIRNSLNLVNSLTRKYAALAVKEFETALKEIQSITSLEERLALLRELHYRLTFAQSNKNPPQGEWMRLEQVVSVLIAMKQDSLLQIDTSEGKTLILQMMAILKALAGKASGQKINVITHNEPLALDAGDRIRKLAHFVGLKTAKKFDSAKRIIEADIYYTDISDAVINSLLAQQRNDPDALLPGNRKANTAIVDEVDNVVIDIHGMTTMQISKEIKDAEPDLEVFLMTLNEIVRKELPKQESLTEQASQRAFVKQALESILKDNPFYRKICQADEELDEFIRAAVSAMGLHKNEDYVVEKDDQSLDPNRQVVHIVHKETTGRVDKISQWGHHIHQCVAAWEKAQGEHTVAIPGITEVLLAGDVVSYLQEHYTSRIGVSGTLGEEPIRQEIEVALKTNVTVIMPRAKRELSKEANWPLRMPPDIIRAHQLGKYDASDQPKAVEVYNRIYQFPPMVADSTESHYALLAEAIQNIQDSGQSCILFLNTIEECNDFFAYLELKSEDNACDIDKVQILDDTRDKMGAASTFRPPESVIIERAYNPGMITLTTAAGSRGIDFEQVTVGIPTKPSIERVMRQKIGRIGRNGEFGLIYEIYNSQDLGKTPLTATSEKTKDTAQEKKAWNIWARLWQIIKKEKVEPPKPKYDPAHHRFFIEPYEAQAEEKMRQRVAHKRERRP